MNRLQIFIFSLLLVLQSNLQAQTQMPDWAKSAVIYEVNIRQYTPEGTFNAFTAHLPRLKEMGVDILWLMPVQPIGELNRKGSLGSYYSIQNYTATNPEFGTMKDFKKMVDEAHKLGMYVILDWVGNHTSWDHAWITDHPEYYTTDKNGKIIPPVADWTDVADLNYDNMNMRKAMIHDMAYWIKEGNIDGFRCDVAMMVPDAFWQYAFNEMREIKPELFMLAEAEGPGFIKDGFNMVYGWDRHHAMNKIAQKKGTIDHLDSLIMKDIAGYPAGSVWMNFTSNHDENSWNGTEFERMGDGARAFATLSATLPGMLLMYSGQEVGLDRRLKFFDKDSISWVDDKQFTPFYSKLIEIKTANPALWNGSEGGSYRRVACEDKDTYVFVREKEGNKVMVIANLSEDLKQVYISNEAGKYVNGLTGKKQKIKANGKVSLMPWEVKVLVM
ncbi:MAG TPA: alpha-amylase family glycosyl hydrolase [Chitinophagales bacterium]|nr:alpha-amylase family glycosyl hydrolase [Chitinophagales bacterium]